MRLIRTPGQPSTFEMALNYCPDCKNPVSSEAFACPHCGRPNSTKSARIAGGGRQCANCGSNQVGKVRGLQGFGEVFVFLVLFALAFIPGSIYYIYIESVPTAPVAAAGLEPQLDGRSPVTSSRVL